MKALTLKQQVLLFTVASILSLIIELASVVAISMSPNETLFGFYELSKIQINLFRGAIIFCSLVPFLQSSRLAQEYETVKEEAKIGAHFFSPMIVGMSIYVALGGTALSLYMNLAIFLAYLATRYFNWWALLVSFLFVFVAIMKKLIAFILRA